MTDQEHPPTEQETAIYDALTAGDHEAIEEMRAGAEDPEALEAFEADYAHAHARYQADHEAPETERIEHTADSVEDENAEADDG